MPSAERRPRFFPLAWPNWMASWISGFMAAIWAVIVGLFALASPNLPGNRHEFGLIKPAAGVLDRVDQRIVLREVREQRAQIGEAFVKRQHVGIGGLREIRPDAVDDRVGHLVRDDVLRQTGENELAGKIAALSGLVRGEVAKQNSVRLRAVIGIGLLHRVRVELENPDIVLLAQSCCSFCEPPKRSARRQ